MADKNHSNMLNTILALKRRVKEQNKEIKELRTKLNKSGGKNENKNT